ncbi:MAG: TM2 domain-containing protein, partial [Candidatus Kapabacteria bacterium]|nr:TM2 domain-containing protein [Candidatus Kapabacteria bacterium]
ELPPEAQEAFWDEYRRRARSVGVAYLCCCVGFHYAYLRRWWRQWLFWFTLGGVLFWWVADFFRLPRLVEETNRDAAMDALRMVRLMGW